MPRLDPGLLDAAQVADQLRHVERLRPGLVRRRALYLGDPGDPLPTALGEHFAECDAIEPTADDRVPFADETFDFVDCGTVLHSLDRARAERLVGELLRVLRLLGVVVLELPSHLLGRAPGAGAGSSQPGAWQPGAWPLPLAPELAFRAELTSIEQGRRAELRVTNASGSTWPSSGVLETWLTVCSLAPDGSRRAAGGVVLPGTLVPGDAVLLSLALGSLPPASELLELELVAGACSPASARASSGSLQLVLPGEGSAAGNPSQLVARAAEPVQPLARDEATALIARQGGVVLGVQETSAHSPAWVCFRYFVAKE